MEKLTVSVKDYCRLTGIAEHKIREIVRVRDDFPCVRVGVKKVRIFRGAADEWLMVHRDLTRL